MSTHIISQHALRLRNLALMFQSFLVADSKLTMEPTVCFCMPEGLQRLNIDLKLSKFHRGRLKIEK